MVAVGSAKLIRGTAVYIDTKRVGFFRPFLLDWPEIS
jgi:hypothetical protein